MTEVKHTSGIIGEIGFQCPIHKVLLRANRFFPDYLMHDGCKEIYEVIDGRLCVLRGGQWCDVESGQLRYITPSRS